MIGAGAAGISASIDLANAGIRVTLVEARDRIGGRIFTIQDPVHAVPVELGAEFIHGRPPQIVDLLQSASVPITEVDGDNWCAEENRLAPCDFSSDVDEILQQLNPQNKDQSFRDFLKTYAGAGDKGRRRQHAEQWATSYVSGFNAADPALVGVHWLWQGLRADEKIEGDRSFRALRGYADLIEIFQRQLQKSGVVVHKNTAVHSVQWRPGRVDIAASSPSGTQTLSAPRTLITVPLGVLQARPDDNGAIRFFPELPEKKQAAIRDIEMGKVIRLTLRFRERFWANLPRTPNPRCKNMNMNEMSFLLSHDDWFPTWWTTSPNKTPFLVGWAPFQCANRLSGRTESFVVERGIATLNRLLGVGEQELEDLLEYAYVHDWQSDPFARGAYSYGKAGESEAPRILGMPIEGTLFFAGEATDVSGHTGTVHGAIASGQRAAVEIHNSARSASGKIEGGRAAS